MIQFGSEILERNNWRSKNCRKLLYIFVQGLWNYFPFLKSQKDFRCYSFLAGTEESLSSRVWEFKVGVISGVWYTCTVVLDCVTKYRILEKYFMKCKIILPNKIVSTRKITNRVVQVLWDGMYYGTTVECALMKYVRGKVAHLFLEAVSYTHLTLPTNREV